MDNYNTKQCTKCSRELPLDVKHFYRSNKVKNGFEAQCKECRGRSFGVKRANQVYGKRKGYAYCSKCRKELPLDSEHFHKSSASKNGFRGTCIKCRRNEEPLIKRRERHTRWRNDNREHVRRYSKKYSEKNREREKEWARQWRLNNPEKQKFKAVKGYNARRSRIRKLPVTFTIDDWKDCKEYFDNKCCYCEREYESMHQDHFVALTKGGEYSRDNIVPACRECNYRKHTKNFFEWYPQYEHYTKEREQKVLNYLGYKNNTQQLSIF